MYIVFNHSNLDSDIYILAQSLMPNIKCSVNQNYAECLMIFEPKFKYANWKMLKINIVCFGY